MPRKVVVVKNEETKRRGLLTYLRREIEHFVRSFPIKEEELRKAMKKTVIIPSRPYTKAVHPLALILLLATLTDRVERR